MNKFIMSIIGIGVFHVDPVEYRFQGPLSNVYTKKSLLKFSPRYILIYFDT